MKKEKDSRIKVKYVWLKEYTIFFLVLAAFNGFHMWIYQVLYRNGIISDNPRFTINILLLFVMVTTVIIVAIIGIIRERLFIRPIKKLGEAARKIAKGDFSVRVTSKRKNDKKDLLDVMFDDFNTMAQELASIETLKNDFIANVSHEIKTPLSIIQSYAIALQSESLPEKERIEYTQTILEASRKLSALVTNILKMNKLENQEIISEAKSFNLSEQLRRCALMFADQMEQKNICFEEDIDEVSVCYDEDILEIIWNNLLSNAIKFTNKCGSINISLKTINENNKKYIKVIISDTGCGMSEETQKRIFDKFYQGDTSHSKDGNGLGLALVKKANNLLGGNITVESTPGHGSKFSVCLAI